jgi:hypothetical protein
MAGAADIGHESFLRHARFRWLKVALVVSLVALIGYIAADVAPRRNGGSWYGYTLGSIGTGLIVWLALLGIRKRAMTAGRWSLKAWTSAHVYLGLALIVIATLHTGFQFGWNVHTLAYALMMLVILSGINGAVAYVRLPAFLSNNREQLTLGQMVEGIAALDRQLKDAAQPLPLGYAELVLAASEEELFARSLRARLSGAYPHCATAKAIAAVQSAEASPVLAKVETLLIRRRGQLDRLRRQTRLKALLEVWLYVHVPATLALIAALTAHVISVFYYW